MISSSLENHEGVKQLSWQSSEGFCYSILFANNLSDYASVVLSGIKATPPVNKVVIPAKWDKKGFFMIRVDE